MRKITKVVLGVAGVVGVAVVASRVVNVLGCDEPSFEKKPKRRRVDDFYKDCDDLELIDLD